MKLFIIIMGENQLFKKYEDYVDVFSEVEVIKFPKSTIIKHIILIEEGTKVPFEPIYKLSEKELWVLREYIEINIIKGWIRPSESSAGALILFILKKDGSLHLCVDYCGLNRVIIQNKHPLSLISEILNRLSEAKLFIYLNLRDIYHYIYIKEEDRWKTAFRTRYRHFKYIIISFELINAPIIFQAYINTALIGLLNIIYIIFLNNILIFSEDLKKHNYNI